MEFIINDIPWKVLFVNPRDPILRIDNDTYTYGVTLPIWNRIYIANNIDGNLLHHVLTHELFHAELISRNVYVPIYIEEVLCDIVADNELEIINISRNLHNNLCRYYNKC